MKRRIAVARLDDNFFNDDEEEEGDDDDDEDEDIAMDRRRRYQKAYRIALDTDTQGYVSSSNAPKKEVRDLRTPQELCAISWAAFMTDPADPTFRIQAMDETNRGAFIVRVAECGELS